MVATSVPLSGVELKIVPRRAETGQGANNTPTFLHELTVSLLFSLWAMCTQSKKWTELVKDGHIHEKEPVLRWKMAHATGANGMYVMGGSEMIQDDYPPSAENGMKYFNDVWLYSVVEPVGWTLLHGGGIPEEGELPAPRRSHIGIVYTNSDGNELLVITGGRTSKE